MVPAILVQKSTGDIIKVGVYPANFNSDGSLPPIDGLDPDLEWYINYEPFIQPEYDPRVYILNIVKEILNTPHPVYTNLNQYKITYVLVKRTVGEITLAIDNSEEIANQSVFPIEQQLKVLALGLGVLFRAVQRLSLNAKEIAIRDKVLQIATKIWQNDQILLNKKQAAQAGSEVDLDSEWIKS